MAAAILSILRIVRGVGEILMIWGIVFREVFVVIGILPDACVQGYFMIGVVRFYQLFCFGDFGFRSFSSCEEIFGDNPL